MAANATLTAIKKSDVRKYLPESRTDPSDWKTGKSRLRGAPDPVRIPPYCFAGTVP